MVMEKLISLAGLLIFLAVAWALSEDRASIRPRLVVWGVLLQAVFAILILKTGPGLLLFDAARVVMTKILDFTGIGASLNEMTSPLYGADEYLDKPFDFVARIESKEFSGTDS